MQLVINIWKYIAQLAKRTARCTNFDIVQCLLSPEGGKIPSTLESVSRVDQFPPLGFYEIENA